jgi:protein-disulfide isomerase
MLGGAVGIALIAVIGLILLNGRGDSKLGGVVAAATTFDASIPRDGQTLGNPDAPVTVEVWSDYQCPYCKNFSENMLPQLVNEYVAAGQARVIYRDFAFLDRAIAINAAGTPVATDEGDSLRAAEAAACAADQGLFWEYHAALFANQHDENGGSFSESRLREIAKIVGLDMDQFNASLDGHAHRAEVLSMYQTAVATGVNSTPTILVNGEEVSVGMYSQLKETIDAALAA